MKEIVILSGKGGVGKSSIAAAAGALLSQKYKTLLVDVDVDAPNLHLILGAKLKDFQDIEASEKAFIDYDKCTGCLTCAETCKFSAIIEAGKPFVANYLCEGCGACAIACPDEAIEIRQVVNGRLNNFEAGDLHLITGELYIGASSSGRIVDIIRTRAKQEAVHHKTDIILTDGPPGIGCPVIATIKGSSFVLVVTEPTPAALHDMARLLEVIDYFKVPMGIVINKSDLHSPTEKMIKKIAAGTKL